MVAAVLAVPAAFCEDTADNAPAAVSSAAPKNESGLMAGPSTDKKRGDYRLQPGDKIFVKIYPEDQYIQGGDMEITPEGNITLPLMGKFNLKGKTVSEASSELQQIIDRDYLVNPEVVIEVKGFKEQSFVILGQVRKPGTYQFPPSERKFTFLQAVSMAGGFSEVANIKKVKIIRQSGGARKILRINAEKIVSGEDPDVDLQSGDVIHVSESLF